MSPKYVRAAFKRAGFKLTNGGHGNRCWQYRSSVVNVRWVDGWRSGVDLPTLTVWDKYTHTDFDSPAKAIRFIQARMSMAVVAGNDFALNTGPRGQLRLVEAA